MSKMKVVDIYGITRVCRAMTQFDGYVRMFERQAFTTEGMALLLSGAPSETVKVYDLPIHQIRTPNGDKFVAIDIDLKALLEVPFEGHIKELERECQAAVGRANANANKVSAKINEMLAMPWWRRALFVLKRSNLEVA